MKPVIQCLAVDDEAHALKIIQNYVNKVPFLEMKLATTSVWEAMDLLKSNSVDLLFLDIQMEDLTGLQLLDIVGKTCPVILTTAYSEYAIKGYEYQVHDYLLKPISFDRFLKAVSSVTPKAKENEPPKEINSSSDPETIFVKGDAKHKFFRIELDKILCIEGLKNYIRFICDDQKIVTLNNLKDIHLELPQDQFIRVHRSFIVNMKRIDRVEAHHAYIGDEQIPIGASYRTAFYEMLKK